ncbi:MAG: T9SS type A sorting domain-containing protein [Bacteroidia bacterium]|nr:T9SS type A sorting domain-containing protein [Bacteroidia bacterium]
MKIIIGGDFTSYDGTAINRIARLNADGTLDGTFNPGTGANGSVRTTSIQNDGKIIIGGDFSSYNGTGRNRIARILNCDIPPVVGAGPDQIVCSGTSVTLSGSGAVSYAWDNGVTNGAAFTPVATTTYTVTGTDGNGCTNTDAVLVTVNSLPTANIIAQTNVSCNGGNNGQVIFTASGGTAPYIFTPNDTLINLTAGNYFITVTDGNTCTATTSTIITEPAVLTASISSQTNVSCNGGNNGQVIFTASGGISPYTYNINDTLMSLTEGIYGVTVTDANNCTTTTSATITEPAAITSTDAATICDGETYTFGTQTLTVAGVYNETFTAVNGCDSVVSLTLTVNALPTAAISGTTTICSGETTTLTASGGVSYEWSTTETTAAIDVTVANTYTVTVTDGNGCADTESAIVTVILIPPAPAWVTFTTTGSTTGTANWAESECAYYYYIMISTDSTFTTWTGGLGGYAPLSSWNFTGLTPNTTYYVYVAAVNSSWEWYAPTRSPGATTQINNVGWCNLQWPTSSAICNETAYTVYAQVYEAGVTDAAGQGAGITAWIGYNNADTDPTTWTNWVPATYNVDFGNNDEYMADLNLPAGSYFYASRFEYSSVYSYGGYSSGGGGFWDGATYISQMLTVNPVYYYAETTAICSGDIYNWHGNNYTTGGMYYDNGVTTEGCDSIYELTLNVISLSTVIIGNDVACFGGNTGSADLIVSGGMTPYTYLWSTTKTTEDINSLFAGTYYVTVNDMNNCVATDSVTINEPSDILITMYKSDVTCYSDSNGYAWVDVTGGTPPYNYQWSNGITSFGTGSVASGTYTLTVTDASGCSDISSVVIYEPPEITGTSSVSICDGETYIFGTQTLTIAGVYNETFTAVNGCDSVVSLTLTVNPVYNETAVAAICDGDSIFLSGSWQTAGGSYYDTLQTVNGCDSIIETILTVFSSSLASTSASICEGDSIFLSGSWQTAGGSYYDTLQTVNGCDSIIETILTVFSSSFASTSASICEDDSIYLAGAWQTQAGIYTDYLLSESGCDSIVETELIVYPSYSTLSVAEVCEGDSIEIGGIWYSLPGIYEEQYMTAAGCDSIVYTELIIHPVYFVNDPIQICTGDSIYLGGVWQTTSGIYNDYYNTGGCDSIVTTELIVTDTIVNYIDISICEGDSIWVGNGWQYLSGIYYDTLFAVANCDSILITDLTVVPPPNAGTGGNDSICEDMTPTIDLFDYLTGYEPDGTWLDDDSSGVLTGSIVDCNSAEWGQYYHFTYIVENGICAADSATVTIFIDHCEGIAENNHAVAMLIYPNPNKGLFTILMENITEDVNTELLDLTGKAVVRDIIGTDYGFRKDFDVSSLPKGIYFLKVTSPEFVKVEKIVVQ